jgi:putative transposase
MRSLSDRRSMVDAHYKKLSIKGQCTLLNVHRSGFYYTPTPETDENLRIMRLFDEQYLSTPFYGIRKMREWLVNKYDFCVNRKRVKRLMGLMGWQTLYRKPNTSWRNKAHYVYPYLLRNLKVTSKNQVWAIDITYVPMRKGFMYLCAIIDLHTRYVINWSLSNTMTAEWCKEVVQEAINIHGKPSIINSDQGSQFTSYEYTSYLKEQEVQISMDGKGRAIDNIFIERLWKSVKYECIYLNVFDDGVKLYEGLQKYFNFYNHERLHQSLEYKTPAYIYQKAA